MSRFLKSALFGPALFAVLFAGPTGCARNPVTGSLQLALISEQQEIQMGREAAAEVERSIGLVNDPALQSYVQDLGRRLAATSERPHLPWSFGVVDDPTPNAFALPGGFIYITRGLLALMGSEAQLVTVLGHEIGHVTARHHVTSMSRAQLAQLGLGIGGVIFPELQGLGGLAGAGLQVLFLSHGRDAERQADQLGFTYSLETGYDVREMPLVFASLQRLTEAHQQSALPAWLMTHPSPVDRIETIERRIRQVDLEGRQLRIGTQTYLNRLDGLVYGRNPRNGFFRESLFLHPELQFQLRFPADWDYQNLAQTVVAVSPQRNAAVQLTLAEDRNLDAAARRFLDQQGIQAGQTSRQTLNGLPAIVSSFRAQSQQQTLQGYVAFVDHGNRIYQIIGYSSSGVFQSYGRILEQSLRSFAPVSDPDVLGRRPDLLHIVRTGETMPLRTFHQRFPSVLDVQELAILNQLNGPDTVVPAGSLLKRVTND